MENAERANLFSVLKGAHPKDFEPGDAIRYPWHRERALASELAMDWDAAVFHWERALSAKSNAEDLTSEIPIESRLAYARQAAEVVRQAMLEGGSRRSKILPRPPWAAPEMLDLGGFYQLALGEPLALVDSKPETTQTREQNPTL